MTEINDEERHARVEAAVLVEQLSPQHGIYYSSFVDASRAEGDQWLGGCFVEADGPTHSLRLAHVHGCNPGGSVQTWGPIPLENVSERYRNRLLSGDEGKQLIEDGPLDD